MKHFVVLWTCFRLLYCGICIINEAFCGVMDLFPFVILWDLYYK